MCPWCASDLRPARRLKSRVGKEDKQLSLFGEVAREGWRDMLAVLAAGQQNNSDCHERTPGQKNDGPLNYPLFAFTLQNKLKSYFNLTKQQQEPDHI